MCVCREREREAGNGQTCLAGPSGRRNWWWDTATVPFPVPSPPLIRDGRGGGGNDREELTQLYFL